MLTRRRPGGRFDLGGAHGEPALSYTGAASTPLEKAGAARRQRAEVKDKLKMGALSLSELFEATDRGDESGNMLAKLKVVSVLESLPGVGKVNAKRLLKGLDISDGRRLGGVGDKQRERLLRVVDDLEYRREILAEARRSEESTAR